MLINPVDMCLNKFNICITGILHIGAHECEELMIYTNILGVNPDKIIWIEAIKSKYDLCIQKGIKHVYNALISDTDDKDILFNIANNFQSSSILELETHKREHPHIHFVSQITMTTIKIETFFLRNKINPQHYNFWNLDIQGAELLALKGGENLLKYVDVIYIEVNEEHLYKDCPLIGDIDNFLSKHNFNREMTLMTKYHWGDALYIRKT